MAMENAKIDRLQFFVLIVLFETGTSLVIGLGIGAGRDAWIAIMAGASLGCLLFLVYWQLHRYYPGDIITGYIPKITGKWIGIPLSYIYIIYFLYLASRVLRDFGELVLTFSYPETPLFIINSIMILLIIYGVIKGIETLARTGELNLIVIYFLAFTGIFLLLASDVIVFDRMRPVLEYGIKPIIKTVANETLYVPFGELVVFSCIFPYLNDTKKARTIGILAILTSGINLSLTMLLNILSIGITVVENSPFPLLATVQEISVANFLERIDVFFLVALFIGAFFKISIFLYAAVTGLANLFHLQSHREITFPFGVIILILSMIIASNFAEHILEGLDVVPIYFHLPMQVIIPILLFMIAYVKNRSKKKNSENLLPGQQSSRSSGNETTVSGE